MKTIRTFIAVDVSAQVQAAADAAMECLRGSGSAVNWLQPENVHLTLKFLGEVPNVEVHAVCREVQAAVAESGVLPFEVDCHGLGAFPDIERARTVWFGVRDGGEPLIQLHDAIDARLPKLGFASERRRFHPHVTLGRVKCGGRERQPLVDLLRTHQDWEVGAWPISEVLIYSSTLEKGGPIYDVMGRAPLG
ncbi:MAG TPA: RNA 2',3'-cyclic phosphodiesterase [Planctomycetaceae bacterium]|nr:RNA 2',3'-cyclic phosphodiesterase [Blastopirellula sp.]HAY79445.1 RNA 2',3'-cyclic phosphodiesterase [Planctomycetaceae bacterium]